MTSPAVSLRGDYAIRGDVHLGPQASLDATGRGTVGATVMHPDPVPCRTIDLVPVSAALSAVNDNAQLPAAAYLPASRALRVRPAGRSRASSSAAVTIPAGVYYLNSIDIRGRVRVDGPVTVVVDGPVDIAGAATVNDGGNPFDLRLFVADPKPSWRNRVSHFLRIILAFSRKIVNIYKRCWT